ncbi:MAG TPA: serine/threonine-protein kinase, partial [Gemmatimonadales bacterium]|nr:serine/threonine-protein kinase [Gemmatimonadales bacterium]
MQDLLRRVEAALEGRYVVERELGRGGMAVVFMGRDVRHGRAVAIKVLRPELAASLAADRFLREIAIASRLTHPHILPLHDSGEVPPDSPTGFPLLYYVMPYVEGESLRDRIQREGPLPIGDALRLARGAAAALAHAHAHGVVHRDIKPENILLEDGEAVVADFGLARALDAAADDPLSLPGLAMGTPAYMSPEQSAGAEVDARTDIYSLGCVLYEMLAGEPPFSG